MSFSKARIQRFNELGSEAPPPGAYDPKFEKKVKGLVIEKSDRFMDTRSTCSAEWNSSITSGKSSGIASTPVFRIPQLPRKQLIMKAAGPAKTQGQTSIVRNQNMKYESTQQLADLQVECLNKDKTIQEHERHIEEMKDDVRKLEAELEKLHKKQIETEEQHAKDIETMAKLQQEIMNNHDNKHEVEMKLLRSQLLEVSEEKEQEISVRKLMETELRNRAAELVKRIGTLEAELCAEKEENKIRIQCLEARIEELLNTLKKVECDRDTEIGLLQQEKCQLDIRVTDLTQERSNLEAKLETRQNVILDLQAQLSALQCELDELKAEYEKLVDNSNKQMSDLTDQHEKEMQHLRDIFLMEKNELLTENDTRKMLELRAETRANDIEETNSFLTEELEDLQRLYKDVSQRLHDAQKELESSNERHNIVIEKYKKDLDNIKNLHSEENLILEQQLKDTKETYLRELENVTVTKGKEMDELKQATTKKIEEETQKATEHAQKMIENAESVTRETLAACRYESEERVKRIIVECDAKVSGSHVNAMIKDAQSIVKEEMRLTNERYETCLARMEEERVTLEEKISQRDAEIVKFSAALEELRSSAETQEIFSQSLQVELDRAETELAEKKEELRGLKDLLRKEAAEMVAKRRRFEVIMTENQASVMALTDRLAQSNAEVERLQCEVKRSEDCIQEHRDLLNVMRNNSQMVHKEVEACLQELATYRDMIGELEANNMSNYDTIRNLCETKIETIKSEATKEFTKLKNDIKQKSLQNDELKKQLDEMAKSLGEAQNLLLKLEERNDVQAVDISRMELANSKLQEQLKSREKALEESNRLVETLATQHKAAIDEANSRIEELSETIKQLEKRENSLKETTLSFDKARIDWKCLENAFKQQLEEERAQREEAEEETKRITEIHNRFKEDYEEVSAKYAEVIGHQNPKQRIKHVTQLKNKIYQLEQDLHTKTKLVEQQQKTIEKLKVEEKRSQWKGKENVGMVHSTPISSPHKNTSTPLRSRND
ncbi:hyaluronan mediated motility receptor isoform X1 [Ooceraea biroi]|uniref:hyaluronan mediated motility receptor isoform X1 n=1 Tax=Ooceraea biroi TaxID=2015173 RepID=UPI000F08BF19|nr:hyaluronan mediated motility receptor isoform X1 [Ooceraea biroi]